MKSGLLQFPLWVCVALLQTQGAPAAMAVQFPIKSEADAIAVAKDVCIQYGPRLLDEDMNETTIQQAMPTLKWHGQLQDKTWFVDTLPSVADGTNDHLLSVDVPVDGPAPKACADSLYTLLGLPPRKPKPRGPCMPSDLSAANAIQLANEAYSREWVGGIMLSPTSEPDAWVVSIRVSAAPNIDSEELGRFRVFKRTANVQNVKTGEEFDSLPSKKHFVELHCLDGPIPAK